MNDEKVYVELQIDRENSFSKYSNYLELNNLISNLKNWLSIFKCDITLGDDNFIVTSEDKNEICNLSIIYPKSICVCDNCEPNILNGNIDWEHALNNDIIKNNICSPEYILSRSSTSNNVIKSKLPFDLASLMILLYYRQASINIPEYHTIREKTKKDNQIVLNSKNRNGKIVALVSNSSTFNFSIRIIDNNIKEIDRDGKETIGHPRTFTLTDEFGNLSDNWKNFEFLPNIEENNFFKDILYYTKDKLLFNVFVNKEKAQCFYSEWYYNMKVATQRLTQEKKYLNSIIQKYKQVEVKENTQIINNSDYKKKEIVKEKVESTKVLCFECIVDEPVISFSYINESLDHKLIYDQAIETLNGINSKLEFYRFITRLVECAWTKLNPYDSDMKPSEFKIYGRSDIKWEPQVVKFPGKRIEWFKCNIGSKSIYCRYFFKQIKQKN